MDQFLELDVELVLVELTLEVGEKSTPVWVVAFHKFLYFGLDLFEGFVFGGVFGVLVDLV